MHHQLQSHRLAQPIDYNKLSNNFPDKMKSRWISRILREHYFSKADFFITLKTDMEVREHAVISLEGSNIKIWFWKKCYALLLLLVVIQRTIHCIYEQCEKWDQVFWNSIYNDFAELRLIMREAHLREKAHHGTKGIHFFNLLFEFHPFFFHLFSSYGSDYKC